MALQGRVLPHDAATLAPGDQIGGIAAPFAFGERGPHPPEPLSLRTGKARSSARPRRSLGLHVALPNFPHSPPSAAQRLGKEKEEDSRVSPGPQAKSSSPHPPDSACGGNSKAASPGLVLVPSPMVARCLGGTSRPPPSLRSRWLAGYCLKEPGRTCL